MYVKITPDPSMISFQPNIAQPFTTRTKSTLQVQIRDSIDALFQEYQKSINGYTHDEVLKIDGSLNVKTSKRSIPEILMEKENKTRYNRHVSGQFMEYEMSLNNSNGDIPFLTVEEDARFEIPFELLWSEGTKMSTLCKLPGNPWDVLKGF